MGIQSNRPIRRDFPGAPNLNAGIGEPVHQLILASIAGDVSQVSILLKSGVDPNIPRDNRGKSRFSITPLMLAAARGHYGVVRTLTQAGALLDVGDEWMEGCDRCPQWGGATALMYALVGGPIDGSVPKSITAENAQVAKYLISDGSNPNASIPFGWDVLGLAVCCGDRTVVEALLDAGAKPEGVIGFTPLDHAVSMARADMVGILLDRGADPHRLGDFRENYLHLALANDKSYEVVQQLIQSGVSCDHPSKDGTTPLWTSIQNTDERIFDLVLAHSINMNPIQYGKYTAVDFAAVVNIPGRVEKLRSRGGKAFDELTDFERSAGAPRKPASRNKKKQ